MSHLPTERLAALADEQPTAEEIAHLAGCAACAREREAYRSLLALSQTTRIGVPITTWESLQPALARDGLIAPGRGRGDVHLERHRSFDGHAWTRRVLQVAAGLVLVAGGVAAGRVSADASPIPGFGNETETSGAGVVASASPAESFASREEALRARALAETNYQNASIALARFDSSAYEPDSPAAIRTRLAALDRVGETMREALEQAPADPVINGYYLTTLDRREAALRQLSSSLPSAVRLNIF